ncbi:MFS transporter [Fructilactobacillus sp. Tb1]|uniref:MFS transporter n=1 Tax=Fructilactobacillus sp. Tb1 TaxID=3422304 RepID=UPI003D2BC9CE
MTFKNKLAILATALLSFCGVLLETSMNVTFPELSKLFSVSLGTVQWITTGYLLVVTITMSMTAYLLKKYPIKTLFLAAAIFFIIGDLLSVMAPNFTILLLGRLIQAGATGISMPMMYHVIFTTVPRHKIGTYVGICSMVISMAPALGPTYGGALSYLLNWRYIFIIVLPIAFITVYLGYKTIDLQPQGVTKHFDFSALALMAITFFAFVWAANQIGIKGATTISWLAPIIIGIITLISFLYVNSHGNSELISFAPMQIKAVYLDAFTYMALMFVNIGISFVIPIYAEIVYGASPLTAGLILLPGSIVGGITSPISGIIYDRFGAFKPILTGVCVIVMAMLLFNVTESVTTSLTLTLLFTLLRFGINMTFSNTISNAQANAPISQTADISSIFNMLQQYAGSLGTTILASVIAFHQNQATSHAEFIAKTRLGGNIDYLTLLILAIIIALVTFYNWYTQSRKKATHENH